MSAETHRQGAESPIDLAKEPDFPLGQSKVSPSRREVQRGSERELLEPRVMQVLVALYQANGQVVSRDDLIARCWEGRIVGEDAINRAIGRLRRLSEVDAEASFQIETIARVGYRLLPATAPTPPILSENPAPSVLQTAVSPARQNPVMRHRLAIAAAVAIMVATTTWLLWPAPHWTVESSRPFVSTLALEGEPAFSPDGKMLAYTSGPEDGRRAIYVRNVTGGDGIKVTGDSYDDVSPTWSSDSTRLAYSARKSGEPCRIMMIRVPAGETREIGRCRMAQDTSIAWQPNSSFLYFTDQRDDGSFAIFRLDLDTGETLDLPKAYPPKIRISNLGHLRASPDGKLLAYLGLEVTMIRHVMIHDLANGKERSLGSVFGQPLAGWFSSDTWSPDSRTILATSAIGSGSEIMAFPVDGSAPYRVYSAATGISYLSASIGGLLAIESHTSRRNLARASPTPIPQPDIIDPANGVTASPTFAPDGTMAFISNRSGTNAMWIRKPGTAPVELFDAGLASMGRQSFSPDGTRLTVGITPITAQNGVTIKVLTAGGGSVASFDMPSPGWGLPTWTPDGKGLIVYDGHIHRAVRVDVADPAHRTPIAPPDWQGITIRGNGTFATREDKPGVWRIDDGIKLLSAKYPAKWGPPIVFLGDDILIPDFNAPDGPRILAQPISGAPDRVFAYAPGAEGFGYQSKLTVNPKTGEIIYVASVQSDTNIDLLTLAKH